MVFRADFNYTEMPLISMRTTRQQHSEALYNCSGFRVVPESECFRNSTHPVSVADGYVPSISATFKPVDECQFDLELAYNAIYAYPDYNGFVSWTNMSTIADLNVPWLEGLP